MTGRLDPLVRQYFDAVPGPRRAHVDALHTLITSLYPQAAVDFAYRMPTYHVADGWVAIANQKHYVSLYTCGARHLAKFKAAHPRIPAGKGCINFKPADALPLRALEQVVKSALTAGGHDR